VTCRELVELVTAYLDGGLTPEERSAFDQHLALCRGCERYLEQFRTTIALLGELPEDTLSSSAREELLGAFAAWRRTSDAQDV
jgi:anti-sigma factor RsiW